MAWSGSGSGSGGASGGASGGGALGAAASLSSCLMADKGILSSSKGALTSSLTSLGNAATLAEKGFASRGGMLTAPLHAHCIAQQPMRRQTDRQRNARPKLRTLKAAP